MPPPSDHKGQPQRLTFFSRPSVPLGSRFFLLHILSLDTSAQPCPPGGLRRSTWPKTAAFFRRGIKVLRIPEQSRIGTGEGSC